MVDVVKTRFAPSPTGFLHIGGVRTALFSYLFAKQHNGLFCLRIEDTDTTRHHHQASQAILEAMDWLGLRADEEVVFQSQNFKNHSKAVQSLLDKGLAYHCDCSLERLEKVRHQALKQGQKPRYDRHCAHRGLSASENTVVRLHSGDEGEVAFDDLIHGHLKVAKSELDDLVLFRQNRPTYNLAVVVDDHQMQMTHIIRGDDHINNTFRQIGIYQALGFKLPTFAHTPLILKNDGSRLSKRDGASNVLDYRQQGYLPQALLNYLFRLGFSDGDKELFSRDEMLEVFNLHKVHKKSAIFDNEKCLWVNQQHILSSREDDLEQSLKLSANELSLLDKDQNLLAIIKAQKTRAQTLKELKEAIAIFMMDNLDFNNFENQCQKHLHTDFVKTLPSLYQSLQSLDNWNESKLKACLDELVEKQFQGKFAKVGKPLRFILTNFQKAGDLAEVMALLGKRKTLKRVEFFLNKKLLEV